MNPFAQRIAGHVSREGWGQPERVPDLVEAILAEGRAAGASDIHLRPTDAALEMAWRIDGVLQPIASLPQQTKSHVITRLKVLGGLLTYQNDRPQEGRLKPLENQASEALATGSEMRLSVIPTLFGEKAVVRLFVGSGHYLRIDDLALPENVEQILRASLHETGGVLLISGPAGSGKTTTAYAALRELTDVAGSGGAGETAREIDSLRSVATLEDPIEAVLEGTSQSHVRPTSQFGYTEGVKAILRQDPDVLLVGEIRDAETAKVVFQASLAGHLVVTTFHAGSAVETISRLLDMGLEPYQIRSGLLAVVNQRLVRQLCECGRWSENRDDTLGLDVERTRVPVGCEACRHTGYRGRFVIAEVMHPQYNAAWRSILERKDAQEIGELAEEAGMVSHDQLATEMVSSGRTSAAEIRRVFGFHRA